MYTGNNPANRIDPSGLDFAAAFPVGSFVPNNAYYESQQHIATAAEALDAALDIATFASIIIAGPEAIAVRAVTKEICEIGAKTAIQKRSVVIGEDMSGRVLPTAKLRNAETYNPTPFTNRNQSLLDNKNWINQKMDEGCTILDCGAAPGRANYPNATSPYYQIERADSTAELL